MQAKAPKILLTGATGNVGLALAKNLAALNIPFRAMVRSFDRARALTTLSGAELILGDFSDDASLANALQGVERAFLLTPSSETAEAQQIRFVERARDVGTPHIVKLSQWAADADSPVRFLRYHAAVEEKIRAVGIPYTFLRPNLFMQGLLAFKSAISHHNRFSAAIGDAKVSLVDVRDIAAVAAAALTQDGHTNKTYGLTGPEALSHPQMAAQLSASLNRRVRFETVSPDTMADALTRAGLPRWQVEGLIEDYAHYARGEATIVDPTIQRITGRAARSFDAFTRDYADTFR